MATDWRYIQVRYDPEVDEILGARLDAAAEARRSSKVEFCRAVLIEAIINTEARKKQV
jgi:hypothetical protein